MHKRKEVIWIDLHNKLLNLSIEGIMKINGQITLSKFCHVHIFYESRHKVHLKGYNTTISRDCLPFLQWHIQNGGLTTRRCKHIHRKSKGWTINSIGGRGYKGLDCNLYSKSNCNNCLKDLSSEDSIFLVIFVFFSFHLLLFLWLWLQLVDLGFHLNSLS